MSNTPPIPTSPDGSPDVLGASGESPDLDAPGLAFGAGAGSEIPSETLEAPEDEAVGMAELEPETEGDPLADSEAPFVLEESLVGGSDLFIIAADVSDVTDEPELIDDTDGETHEFDQLLGD